MSSPDPEGRCITVEFDAFVLIVTYAPHPGSPSGHLRLKRSSGSTAPAYATLPFRLEEWEPKLHEYMRWAH
jgi:hypothetical protein